LKFIILFLFSSVLLFADDVTGRWSLSQVNFDNNIVQVGNIIFQEDGTYTINHKSGNIYGNTWKQENDYFMLASLGFYIEWENKRIFYLIPAFGSQIKKYIFIKEKL